MTCFNCNILILNFHIYSIHNLLTSSQSSGAEQDKVLNSNSAQPQPPPHQRPPPPRHAISEGGSQTRFRRSDSAPPYPRQPAMPMESLVVNLNQGRSFAENRNIEGPAERSRFVPTSPLPPPPAPKSVYLAFSISFLIVNKYISKQTDGKDIQNCQKTSLNLTFVCYQN